MFSVEIMSSFKAIKPHLKNSHNDKQNLTLVVISYEMTTRVRSSISVSTRGKAIVVYICVPHEVFENCRHFKVRTSRSIIQTGTITHLLGERSKAPDHSALMIKFYASHTIDNMHVNVHCSHENLRDQKRCKLKSIPNDFLSSDLSKLALVPIY